MAYNHKKYVKEWRKKNAERMKFLDRRLHLKQYSMTIEDYDKMLKKQNGVCAICGSLPTRNRRPEKKPNRLGVDHDHETGKIRGLLCIFCNFLVGKIERDAKYIPKVRKYLRSFREEE